jgi:hypothetical protein
VERRCVPAVRHLLIRRCGEEEEEGRGEGGGEAEGGEVGSGR